MADDFEKIKDFLEVAGNATGYSLKRGFLGRIWDSIKHRKERKNYKKMIEMVERNPEEAKKTFLEIMDGNWNG